MKINEACKITGLTRKAIDYYSEQGLITLHHNENGYRVFTLKDIERLKQIRVLRMLGVTVAEIKEILQGLEPTEELRRCIQRKQLEYEVYEQQIVLLKKLADGKTIDEIEPDICSLNDLKTIKIKILEAFPGYIGRYYLTHFGPFLEETIHTKEQKQAFKEVIDFLDNVKLPKQLKSYIKEYQKGGYDWSEEKIASMEKNKLRGLDNIEQFMEDNKKFIQAYQEFKNSDEYRNSTAGQFAEYFKEFCKTSGYNDRFLPAMRRLSYEYDAYCKKLENANKVFLEKYPEYK